MIKVGLTGGIGSGKTTVAKIFQALNIPVFFADLEAKKLLDESELIKVELMGLFGEELYKGERLDRKLLAEIIFNNPSALEKVNSIVHPTVAQRFNKWTEIQESEYVIEEAAILFETGGYKLFDKTILVSAPKELRISRIEERDGLKRDQILARIKNQWDENHKKDLADFVILNDEQEMLLPQIMHIHESLLRFANSRS